jgi:hypothetical protein
MSNDLICNIQDKTKIIEELMRKDVLKRSALEYTHHYLIIIAEW